MLTPLVAVVAAESNPGEVWRDVGPQAETTCGAQSAFVLPVPGKPGRFIFLADRWKPQQLSDSRYVWLPFQIKPGGSFTSARRDFWSSAELR